MLRLRNRMESGATPRLPLSWEDTPEPEEQSAASVSPQEPDPAKPEPPSVPSEPETPRPLSMENPSPTATTPPPSETTTAAAYAPSAPSFPMADSKSEVFAQEELTKFAPADGTPASPAPASTPDHASAPLRRKLIVRRSIQETPQPITPPSAAPPQEDESALEDSVDLSPNLGKLLLSQRMAAGISVLDISQKLRCSSELIDHLEQGDYTRLPPDQTCFRILELLAVEYDLDADLLKRLFEQESAPYKHKVSSYVEQPRRLSPRTSIPGILIGVLILGIFCLVLFALFYRYSHGNDKPQPSDNLTPEVDLTRFAVPKNPPLDLLRIPNK